MTFPWFIDDIADTLHAGLCHHAAMLDEEQAIKGLDALAELAFHPLLTGILISRGYGVQREHRYPADLQKRNESEGERCDLILFPEGKSLRQSHHIPTLFDPPPEDMVDLDEAFWMEVKVVAQFTEDGPNRTYTSQLLSTVRHDITKLAKDPGILHAGLLLILFTQDETVASHDLEIWQTRCLERGLPIGTPDIRHFPITDRLGNGCATTTLYPVHRH